MPCFSVWEVQDRHCHIERAKELGRAPSSDHTSVCIVTHRRPGMLERLFPMLGWLDRAGLFDFSVLVVDDCAEGSGRDTVATRACTLQLEITYGFGRGISTLKQNLWWRG